MTGSGTNLLMRRRKRDIDWNKLKLTFGRESSVRGLRSRSQDGGGPCRLWNQAWDGSDGDRGGQLWDVHLPDDASDAHADHRLQLRHFESFLNYLIETNVATSRGLRWGKICLFTILYHWCRWFLQEPCQSMHRLQPRHLVARKIYYLLWSLIISVNTEHLI